MDSKVHVTGMNSGQNPCAGLGIARSIHKAFPNLEIVGVEHWQGSSGFHDEAIKDVVILPPWEQMEDEVFAKDITSLLDDGHVWIPGLDLEIYWLAQNLKPHRNLLSPDKSALEMTAKPAVKALDGLGFRIPEFISASLPDTEIHTFLRQNSWQCWLKSRYQDAKRVTSWPVFEQAREAQKSDWRTSNLFIQQHIVGWEETVAFAAHEGKLLGAAQLEKKILTPEGKTWAGRVNPVAPEFYEQLSEVVKKLNWSGGGEIEYVRDPDDKRWIIELNPRFPAWIYGGALVGLNLPARLISHVLNIDFEEVKAPHPYFTRVVHEIPVKESVGLPPLQDPSFVTWSTSGKKGGGPLFASQPKLEGALSEEDLENGSTYADQEHEVIPPLLLSEIKKAANDFSGESPLRITLEEWTKSKFTALADKVQQAAHNHPRIRIGYSVKTSPTETHLVEAKKNGFFAECISQMEVHRALKAGYRPDQVMLNGPGKFWPITQAPVTGLHMLFCDSVEEYERVLEIPDIASCVGFRMKLPKLESRFGNSLSEFDDFKRIISAIRKNKNRTKLGFHFHMPSWAIGVQRWMDGFKSLLIWCQSIEQLTKTPIKVLDLGGGFYPGDVDSLDFDLIQEFVSERLPSVDEVYFEFGRSLTQQTEALVSRVLDVRRTSDNEIREVVVDASIAELPLARTYPHRVFFKSNSNENCEPLRKGTNRILGRICMEDDILCSAVDLPESIDIGDLVIFGDSGGYERTMSYVFGRG